MASSSSLLLPKTTAEFSKEEYWNQFFTNKKSDAFEWYGDYEELSQQLHKYISVKDNLLIVGCGNSNMSAQLYNSGIKNQISIDISSVVIDKMKTTYPFLSYAQEDVTQLTFPDETFSCVLDKGTFDALTTVPDESSKKTDLTQNSNLSDGMLTEIARVLKPRGRFICISLLQEFVATKLFNFFYSNGWMIRVCRCPMAEDKNRQNSSSVSGGSILPVYMVICTKVILPTGMKPVIEMTLTENDTASLTRLDSVESLLKHIKEQLTFAFIRKNISTLGFCAENGLDMKLTSVDGQSRFSLHIVDVPGLIKNPVQKQFAVFIVPQGRECEYIFGTHEGCLELAEQTGFSRLVVVHLEREQYYESFQSIQDEIAAYLYLFAPTMVMLKHIKAPILTIDEDMGERKILLKDTSHFSGDMVVEDVTFQVRVSRRLIFLAHPTIIQSEVEMEIQGSSNDKHDPSEGHKKKRKHKNKSSDNNINSITSKEISLYKPSKKLACQHHGIMCIAFGILKRFFSVQDPMNALLIGLGGGLLASFLHNFIPDLTLTNVEIDEKIVKIAHDYFGLPQENDRFRIVIQDGLKFLQSTESKYNVILLDVDNKSLKEGLTAPPPEFLTIETLETIKTKLAPEGIFVLNLTCRSLKLKSDYLNTIVRTYPFVYGYRVEDQVNMIIFCCMKEPVQPTDQEIKWTTLLTQSIHYVNEIQGYSYNNDSSSNNTKQSKFMKEKFETLVTDICENFKILKVE